MYCTVAKAEQCKCFQFLRGTTSFNGTNFLETQNFKSHQMVESHNLLTETNFFKATKFPRAPNDVGCTQYRMQVASGHHSEYSMFSSFW